MSDSELLLSYLDGDIAGVDEVLLFNRLASSEELRTELRDYLFVRDSVRADAERLLPPARLKGAILGAIDLPGGPASVGPVDTRGAWRRGAMMATLVMLLLGTGAYLLLDGSNEGSNGRSSEQASSAIVAPITTSQAGGTASGIASRDNTASSLANSQPTNDAMPGRSAAGNVRSFTGRGITSATSLNGRSSAERRSVNGNADNEVRLGADVSRETPTEPITSTSTSTTEVKVVSKSILSEGESPFTLDSIADPAAQSTSASAMTLTRARDDRSRISVEAAGALSRSWPSIDRNPELQGPFSDSRLGLAYDVDGDLSLALELGREPFAQIYRTIESGTVARYEQHPSLFWIGVGARYRFLDEETMLGFRPYTHLLAGATINGPLAKMGAGIEYTPDTRVSLRLGAEGSLLGYQQNDSWFITRKLGVVYGMSLRID